MTATPLSDGEYLNLYQSIQAPQQHVCSRQCHYKQVRGDASKAWSSVMAAVKDSCSSTVLQKMFSRLH